MRMLLMVVDKVTGWSGNKFNSLTTGRKKLIVLLFALLMGLCWIRIAFHNQKNEIEQDPDQNQVYPEWKDPLWENE